MRHESDPSVREIVAVDLVFECRARSREENAFEPVTHVDCRCTRDHVGKQEY